jgi:hypothetical protein
MRTQRAAPIYKMPDQTVHWARNAITRPSGPSQKPGSTGARRGVIVDGAHRWTRKLPVDLEEVVEVNNVEVELHTFPDQIPF